MTADERSPQEKVGVNSGSQGLDTAGNKSSEDKSPSDPTIVTTGEPGEDAGPSAQSLNEGRVTGHGHDKTAKDPSSLLSAVGEKGSVHERRE